MWNTIERHIDEVAEACRISNIWVDEKCQERDTRYTSSLLMPVCLERYRDINHGGAASHLGHWEAMGLPNAVEMTCAATKLAVEADESLASLFNRLDAGDTKLFRQLRKLPKFGNDYSEVDQVGNRLVTMMSSSLERRKTPFRTALVLGLWLVGRTCTSLMGWSWVRPSTGARRETPLQTHLLVPKGERPQARPQLFSHSASSVIHGWQRATSPRSG